MTRSVVTGAAGFVGSHLVERLLVLGHEVVGIDCFTDYYDRALKESNIAAAKSDPRFRFLEDDLVTTDLARLLDGATYVFHPAGQAGVRASWGSTFDVYTRNNITATQLLLEAATKANVEKLVYASSSSVYGNAGQVPVAEDALPQPVSPYGVTKLAAEHLCSLYAEIYGLPAVLLRLFTVYGPRQRPDMLIGRLLSASLSADTVTIFGDGTQTRDFTFVGDVVDAHISALDAPAEPNVFNICGGSTISVNDLIDLVRDVTGRELNVTYGDGARGDARHTCGDNSRAQAVIGFEPKVSLRDGITAHWDWLRRRGAPASS